MQCFQKDPNLRVSARKLLKHPWIVNARRSDSVVPTHPPKYDEAVKSVQQWNEALKSPDANSLRKASRPSSSSPIPGRRDATPTQLVPTGAMTAAKSRKPAETFRSPPAAQGERPWICRSNSLRCEADRPAQRIIGTMTLTRPFPQVPSTSHTLDRTTTLAACCRPTS